MGNRLASGRFNCEGLQNGQKPPRVAWFGVWLRAELGRTGEPVHFPGAGESCFSTKSTSSLQSKNDAVA